MASPSSQLSPVTSRDGIREPHPSVASPSSQLSPVVSREGIREPHPSVASASSQLSPVVSREGIREPHPSVASASSQSWNDDTEDIPPYASYGNPGLSRPNAQGTRSTAPERRPEKQTAVASRMIAGALGVRAPKRTEEQKAYDRATKEKEIKRRNQEKEKAAKEKEEEEKAKAAIWDE